MLDEPYQWRHQGRYGEKLYPPISSIHDALRHQWTGSSSTNGVGGIFLKEFFITVWSSWYSVKASCSLAIGGCTCTFQSTKTKLNVKLLNVVDDYRNAEFGVAVIYSYNYLHSMSPINDTRCNISLVARKYVAFRQKQPLRKWKINRKLSGPSLTLIYSE